MLVTARNTQDRMCRVVQYTQTEILLGLPHLVTPDDCVCLTDTDLLQTQSKQTASTCLDNLRTTG